MSTLESLAAPAIAVAEPGDTLILSFAEMLSQAQAHEVRERIRAIAPHLTALIFENGTRIVIQRAGGST